MSTLAPVESMSPRALAIHLGTDSFREWVTYEGRPIINLNIDFLLRTDAAFQEFWLRRCAEEVRAFERILLEGDFLDVTVSDFFATPAPMRRFLPDSGRRLMRQWAESRLLRARENLDRLMS